MRFTCEFISGLLFFLLIVSPYKFKKTHSLTSLSVSHTFPWSQCLMQWCLRRSLQAWCSDWWSSSWWSLGLKLQDYCVPAGRRALPRPANQHIHHERRKPAWQTPTHLRSIPSLRCWITHREWRRRTHQTCKSATEKYPVQWSLPPVLRWLLDIQREDNNKTTERSLCFHKAEITGIMCPLWGRLFEIIYYIELFSQISLIWVLAQWVTIKIINGVTLNSSH